MRNKPETLHEYNIPRLHWWFLLSSAAFIGCLILMIWVDYSGGELRWLGLRGDRGWKQYQREFFELEKKRLAADAQAAQIKASEAGLDRYLKELDATRTALAAKRDEEAQARAEAERARVAASLVTRTFTMEKATRDEYRSFYEAALERNAMNMETPEVRDWLHKVTAQNQKVDDLDLEKQRVDLALQQAEENLQAIIGRERQLESNIKRLEDNIKLIKTRLEQLSSPLVQAVVTAPVLEFAASPFKVEQIVAENHHVDVNFVTVPRVDRCVTCHKAIDRKNLTSEELDWRAKHNIEAIEWSKKPHPLKNHPRMDLYIADTSPHPSSKYGCTVCHWGWDRETDFSRAGHTPDDEEKHPYAYDPGARQWARVTVEESGETHASVPVSKAKVVEMTQKDAWKKNYGWKHQEFLTQPMRSAKYVQASCLKCHTEQTNLPGAEKLDHGRRLIGQLGCWSCHKMKQLETYSTHKIALGEDFDSICKFYDVEPDQVRRLNNLPREVSLNIGQELSIPIRVLHKDGPSLYKVAGKTNKDWVRKWLANPVAFKPNTYMPRFWGLSNNVDPDRDAVEINAVTEYLFAVSERPQYPPPPVTGDAETGKKSVGQLGCFGCHVIDERLMDLELPEALRGQMDDWAYRRARTQGPQLAGLGSKTTVNWLYAWLKDPKQYHSQTKMPALRLTDQEAADVAEFLAGLHHETTDRQQLPPLKPHKLDEVTVEYLQNAFPRPVAVEKLNSLDDLIEQYFVDEETAVYYRDPTRLAHDEARQQALQKEYEETYDDAISRRAEQLAGHIAAVKRKMQTARETVAAMNLEQKKNVYLGSQLVSRYGCFGCHNIHGFETAKPIGTELSEWGSKPVNKLDFGLVRLEHDRIAWLKQKLRDPRSFDAGRIGVTRTPQELLKMPKFNLTEEQIDQIVTFVSGMTDEKLTYQEPRYLSPAEFHIERGRWLVKELNCVGCHIVEGQGGAIRATGVPAGMEPPMLSGTPAQLRQGQRTRPDWLFQFLKEPKTGEIRPWLHVRMPTFGLSDAEANILVKYFALEGRTQFPYVTPKVDASPEHVTAGKQLFDQLKCALCHLVEGKALGKPLAEIPEEDLPRLAPDLTLAHKRLQRDWLIEKWLPEPLAQVPGTRMPQFEYGPGLAPNILGGDGRKQREALVDYVLSLGAPAEQTAAAQPSQSSPDQ
jgi:cbb3-type cytochrome oxidase cytochrome c subunit/cytochrome c551/c552